MRFIKIKTQKCAVQLSSDSKLHQLHKLLITNDSLETYLKANSLSEKMVP